MVYYMFSLDKVLIVYFGGLECPSESCLICQIHTTFKRFKSTFAEKFSDQLVVVALD